MQTAIPRGAPSRVPTAATSPAAQSRSPIPPVRRSRRDSCLRLTAPGRSPRSPPKTPPMSSNAAATWPIKVRVGHRPSQRARRVLRWSLPSLLSLGQGVARAAQWARRRCDRPVGAGRSAALRPNECRTTIWAMTDRSFSGQDNASAEFSSHATPNTGTYNRLTDDRSTLAHVPVPILPADSGWPIEDQCAGRPIPGALRTLHVRGHEKVSAGGHGKSPLVASGSPCSSLKHPRRVSLGR